MITLLLAMAVFATGAARAAAAQDDAVYVAIYVEAVPQSVKAVSALLKAEAAAISTEDGSLHVRALREIGQDNRFVLLEVWADQSAFDAHHNAPHVQQFLNQLNAMAAAPPDERVLAGTWLGPALNPISADAIWVVTHVDVMPSYADQAVVILKALGEASAKEPGNLRFGVTHQPDHTNHFTVGEAWSDKMSFDAHLAAPPTKGFRRDLSPMLGALYDQRIYRDAD